MIAKQGTSKEEQVHLVFEYLVFRVSQPSMSFSPICVHAENVKLDCLPSLTHPPPSTVHTVCTYAIIIAAETKKLLFSQQTPAPNSSQQTMDAMEKGSERQRERDYRGREGDRGADDHVIHI